MNATTRKRGDEPPRSARRAIPDLVMAQLAGVMGGLVLALGHCVPSDPRRYKLVDRELTRC